MEENKVTINELIGKVSEAMLRGGYDIRTVYTSYHPRFSVIAPHYRKSGNTFYNPDVTAEFMKIQKRRKERDEITAGFFKGVRSAAYRLAEYFLTGEIRVIDTTRATKFIVNAEHGRLIDRFIEWRKYRPEYSR